MYLNAVPGRSLQRLAVTKNDIATGFTRIQEPLSFAEIETSPLMRNIASFNKVKDQLILLRKVERTKGDHAKTFQLSKDYVDEWLKQPNVKGRKYRLNRTTYQGSRTEVWRFYIDGPPKFEMKVTKGNMSREQAMKTAESSCHILDKKPFEPPTSKMGKPITWFLAQETTLEKPPVQLAAVQTNIVPNIGLQGGLPLKVYLLYFDVGECEIKSTGSQCKHGRRGSQNFLIRSSHLI